MLAGVRPLRPSRALFSPDATDEIASGTLRAGTCRGCSPASSTTCNPERSYRRHPRTRGDSSSDSSRRQHRTTRTNLPSETPPGRPSSSSQSSSSTPTPTSRASRPLPARTPPSSWAAVTTGTSARRASGTWARTWPAASCGGSRAATSAASSCSTEALYGQWSTALRGSETRLCSQPWVFGKIPELCRASQRPTRCSSCRGLALSEIGLHKKETNSSFERSRLRASQVHHRCITRASPP